MVTDLRFILRDGKRILQMKQDSYLRHDEDGEPVIEFKGYSAEELHLAKGEWEDVPFVGEYNSDA